MIVLFNAGTVKFGGGLSVALNFISHFSPPPEWTQVLLVSPQNCGFEKIINSRIIKHIPVKNWLLFPLFRPLFELLWLKHIIDLRKVNLIFNLGNLPLPYVCKQVLLFDNPFSSINNLKTIPLSFKNRLSHQIRNYLFKKRLKYLNLIIVQTQLQKNLLKNKYNNIPHLVVIPNTYSDLSETDISHEHIIPIEKSKINLLAFGRYYEHKNLEILLELAKIFKIRNSHYKIYLTIEKIHGKGAKKLLRKVIKYKLESYIINLGEIKNANLNEFYGHFQAIVFPTLLESYSSVYIEAIMNTIPILTSDKDFAHEICKNLALYFNPLSALSIYTCIDSLFSSPEKLELLKDEYKKSSKDIPDWYEISTNIVSELLKL